MTRIVLIRKRPIIKLHQTSSPLSNISQFNHWASYWDAFSGRFHVPIFSLFFSSIFILASLDQAFAAFLSFLEEAYSRASTRNLSCLLCVAFSSLLFPSNLSFSSSQSVTLLLFLTACSSSALFLLFSSCYSAFLSSAVWAIIIIQFSEWSVVCSLVSYIWKLLLVSTGQRRRMLRVEKRYTNNEATAIFKIVYLSHFSSTI